MENNYTVSYRVSLWDYDSLVKVLKPLAIDHSHIKGNSEESGCPMETDTFMMDANTRLFVTIERPVKPKEQLFSYTRIIISSNTEEIPRSIEEIIINFDPSVETN